MKSLSFGQVRRMWLFKGAIGHDLRPAATTIGQTMVDPSLAKRGNRFPSTQCRLRLVDIDHLAFFLSIIVRQNYLHPTNHRWIPGAYSSSTRSMNFYHPHLRVNEPSTERSLRGYWTFSFCFCLYGRMNPLSLSHNRQTYSFRAKSL